LTVTIRRELQLEQPLTLLRISTRVFHIYPDRFKTKFVVGNCWNSIAGQTFQRYDFGPTENQLRYGQATPPAYDLSQVTCPVFLFWGQSDKVYCTQNLYSWNIHLIETIKRRIIIKLIRSILFPRLLIRGYIAISPSLHVHWLIADWLIACLFLVLVLGCCLVGFQIGKFEGFYSGRRSIVEPRRSLIFTGRQTTSLW
jgi:hypothetical protein